PGATITLDKNNLPKVSMGMSRDMLSFYSNTKNILNGILLKNGCRLLNMELIRPDGFSYRGIRFSTAHQVGSCRMAENIDEGVVDPSGEVFNYKGMYITDGSAIPASTGVNISLTILANAERITHGIIEKLRN
ncbi:MAG TPA: GMC family oxidoreductase, partial [Cyclobacteriaceae bacterium]|nr:GMC family oxidoreductase [Cyclobacteriaceae bacterium]